MLNCLVIGSLVGEVLESRQHGMLYWFNSQNFVIITAFFYYRWSYCSAKLNFWNPYNIVYSVNYIVFLSGASFMVIVMFGIVHYMLWHCCLFKNVVICFRGIWLVGQNSNICLSQVLCILFSEIIMLLVLKILLYKGCTDSHLIESSDFTKYVQGLPLLKSEC